MRRLIALFVFALSISVLFSQVPNIDTMLPKIEAEKNDSIRARMIWSCLGTSEMDPVLDMQIAEKLLVQAKKLKDPMEEVFALACLGYDYRLFGDNKKSWKYNLEAMEVAEKNPNEEAKALSCLALALNYQDVNDFAKTSHLLFLATDYSAKTNFDQFLVVCYMCLGDFYLVINKVDSALIYSQKGYELGLRIGYRDYLGPLLQQQGSIHERLGNSTLAISYYKSAVDEGYKMNSPKFVNTSYTAIAQYYYNLHQVDSATLYAKKAIAAVQNTAFTNYNLSASKLLLDIYRNKNIDSAFKYSEIYRMANDSLFNAKTIQQTQLMGFEENVRQQRALEEKLNAEVQRKQNIQYVLIALGIITFIVLFLLLSRSFITNTKLIEFFGVIALLIVFEFLNLLLHPFLENKTQHSPLLMLLSLVCIAALLVPLHHKTEKWSTNKLVEKNKAIRLANAKKTIQKLEGKSAVVKDDNTKA